MNKQSRREVQKAKSAEGMKKYFENDKCVIYDVLLPESSYLYGKGTK